MPVESLLADAKPMIAQFIRQSFPDEAGYFDPLWAAVLPHLRFGVLAEPARRGEARSGLLLTGPRATGSDGEPPIMSRP